MRERIIPEYKKYFLEKQLNRFLRTAVWKYEKIFLKKDSLNQISSFPVFQLARNRIAIAANMWSRYFFPAK